MLAADNQGGHRHTLDFIGTKTLAAGRRATGPLLMEHTVRLRDVFAVRSPNQVVACRALHVLAGAEGVVGLDSIDEFVDRVKLNIGRDEVANRLRSFRLKAGAAIHDHKRARHLRLLHGQAHRDNATHRMAHHDRTTSSIRHSKVGEKAEGVHSHRLRSVIGVAGPFTVAVAALIQRIDVETIGQVKADQVPGMRRLIATVQHKHRRCIRLAPLQIVETEMVDHDITGNVANDGGMGDPEVSSALQQTAKLVELGHVQCVSTVSELVQVHPRLLPQRIADRRKYTFSVGPGLALNLQSTVRRRRT